LDEKWWREHREIIGRSFFKIFYKARILSAA